MKEIIQDTLLDGIKLLPFLLIAFLLIELVEHKYQKQSQNMIKKSGKFGPLFGGLLGCFPQCGFSVMATNLYVTRIISLGTLISIYLSTSDEMLPILISNKADLNIILSLVLTKLCIGIIAGFIIDFCLRTKQNPTPHNLCEQEHCHCEKGILGSSLKHTLKTITFILLISFLINILMYYGAEEYLYSIFHKNSILSPFIASLIGLIPNCGASIALTELYLNGMLPFHSIIAGLLTGSGVALLVLFKMNKNIKENLTILALIYLIGAFSGIFLQILNIYPA